MGSTDGQPQRRRWVLPSALLGTCVAAAAVTTVVLVSRADTPSPPTCVGPASAPAGVTAPAGQAPGGGGLRVVEHGFTPVGTADRPNAVAPNRVSLGAVLENTSSQIAYRTRVTLRVLDAQGKPAEYAAHSSLLVQELPVVRPGQRVAVGNAVSLHESPSYKPEKQTKVTQFDVLLGDTHWLSPEEAGKIFATVGTRYLRTQLSAGDPNRGTGAAHYTMKSGYCESVPRRGSAVLFRDRSGKVLGGDFDHDMPTARCLPGESADRAEVYESIPPEAELGRTEITPYCDIAAPPSGPRASGAPIN